MQRISTLFLQAVIALLGIGVLAAMLREPWLEGVNANAAGISDIYFDDPFLAYAYLASIPFFIGLYQTYKVVGCARHNTIFSETAIKAVRTIRHCALVSAGAVIGAIAYVRIGATTSGDDPAGAIMLGLVATLLSLAVGAAAIVAEDVLRKGHSLKA